MKKFSLDVSLYTEATNPPTIQLHFAEEEYTITATDGEGKSLTRIAVGDNVEHLVVKLNSVAQTVEAEVEWSDVVDGLETVRPQLGWAIGRYLVDSDVWDMSYITTPDGMEAEEFCPICGRPNHVGAADHCKHYVGSVYGADLIWGDVEALGLLDRFCAIWETQDIASRAAELAVELEIDSRVISLAHNENGGLTMLLDLFDFFSGDGDGTLYHDDIEGAQADLGPLERFVQILEVEFMQG